MDRQASQRRSRDEEDVKNVKLVFFVGLLALPWLWIAVLVRYRKRLNDPDAPEELRLYLRRCLIGAVTFACLFIAWVVTFQLSFKNTTWGQSLLLWSPNPYWWQNAVPLQ